MIPEDQLKSWNMWMLQGLAPSGVCPPCSKPRRRAHAELSPTRHGRSVAPHAGAWYGHGSAGSHAVALRP